MSESASSFVKNAPVGFELNEQPFGHEYQYYLTGKGCVLGVLFQDSTHVYFEWLLESGEPVSYRAGLRYKAWSKPHFQQLVSCGIWEPTCDAGVAF